MDYSIHFDTISMELSILNFKRLLVIISMKIVFILANSEDTDRMPLYVAFHLDFHCSPKYNRMERVNQKNFYEFVVLYLSIIKNPNMLCCRSLKGT